MRTRKPPVRYGADELAWLDANRTLPIADYHRAFVDSFARSDVTAQDLHGLRKRKGWRTGRTGHFPKGGVSHNKGKKMPFNANSARTQFRKGMRQGRAVKLYQPIGTERLSRSGYLERKIHDGMPLQSRWRAVHLIRWEEVNGPIPKGIALKCFDGDKSNTDPSNWEAVPRAILPRLNGGRFKWLAYDEAEPEIRPAILAVAKLEHAAREKRSTRGHA